MRCEVCGAADLAPAMTGIDRLLHVAGKFALGRCPACGAFGQDPPPSDARLLEYYPEEYGPYRHGGWLSQLAVANGLRARERHVLSLGLKPGAMLDVGCATGRFLDRMRRRGWNVTGVELVPGIAQRARDLFGLSVITGTLETAGITDQSYDLVTLWDVLEHVRSPRRTLCEITRILRPGGWLVFRVPNPDSVGARVFGDRWAGWDFPRHLWIAPKTALDLALTNAGLRLVRASSTSGRFALSALSIRYTAQRMIHANWLANAVSWVGSSPFARLASAPYFALSSMFGQGSLLTFFAQKV